jgi:ATP-binding cassette subfamily F protein 3
MFSTSVLADAISQYKGTCVIVSHDRTFVSNVATKIWWIENGMLREYPGTYDEWNEWMQRRGPETYLQEPSQSKPKSTDSKGQDNVSAEPKKPGKNRMLQLEQEMADLEKQMEAVRAEKAMHEQRLTDEDVAVDFDKINTHTQAYQKAETQLKELQTAYDAVMEQWIAGTE